MGGHDHCVGDGLRSLDYLSCVRKMRAYNRGWKLLTVDEVTVVVLDTLSEVHVASKLLALAVTAEATKDGNVGATLDVELDVFNGVREVHAVPVDLA